MQSDGNAMPVPAPGGVYTFSQKWGEDPFTALGFTQVPNALIEYGAVVGLTMIECWLVSCILRYKRTPDNPYPSQAELARLVGKDERTIRRILSKIEAKGLLKTEQKQSEIDGLWCHNVYDFTPLRTALNAAYFANKGTDNSSGGHFWPPDNSADNSAAPADTFGKKTAFTGGHFCPIKKSSKIKKILCADGTELSGKTEPAELTLSMDIPTVPSKIEPIKTVSSTPKPNASAVFLDAFKALSITPPTLLPRHHKNLKDYCAAVTSSGHDFKAICLGFAVNEWARERAHDIGILIAAVPEKWEAENRNRISVPDESECDDTKPRRWNHDRDLFDPEYLASAQYAARVAELAESSALLKADEEARTAIYAARVPRPLRGATWADIRRRRLEREGRTE